MDPTGGKAADFERRASMRRSVRLSTHGGDDDEYEVLAMSMANGFAPTMEARPAPDGAPDLHQATPSTSASASTSTLQTPESAQAGRSRPATPPRPSSVAKQRPENDSFALRNEGPVDSAAESVSPDSPSSLQPSPVFHVESPYQGPSGPSFPYQMYPQGVRLARTPSLATTSTAAPLSERSYAGPRSPAHPYGMYPQSIAADAETLGGRLAPVPIQVGFPGMASSYQRRLGPDGELSSDIIGPDGHTEELPPYTRYPDEAYVRKVRDAEEQERQQQRHLHQAQPDGVAVVGASIEPPPVVRMIPGAGGIGLATRNPEFGSTDDLGSPTSRHSSRSFTSASDNSQQEINSPRGTMTEKDAAGRWKGKSRRRICGLPVWVLGCAIMFVIVLGVVLGTVVGTFLAKRKPPSFRREDDSLGTLTIMVDAVPLPTPPPDLPDMPVGTFSLPFNVNRAPNMCFNDTTQAQAWSCNVFSVGQSGIKIARARHPSPTHQYEVTMTCNETYLLSNKMYIYGQQPPCIKETALLTLVNDALEPNRGPAWWFQRAYNKTIVLPESLFNAPTASPVARRDRFGPPGFGDGPGPGGFKRKGVANPGDRPWICEWPGTVFEMFIYAQQNTSMSQRGGGPGGGSANSATRTQSTTVTSTTTTSSSTTPTATIASVIVLADGSTTTVPPPPPSSTASREWPRPSDFGPDPDWKFDPPPPAYPRVMKFEDRRFSGPPSQPPVCRQFQIGEGGDLRPVLDAEGNPIEVWIVESESKRLGERSLVAGQSDPASFESYIASQFGIRNAASDLSDCGCLWFIT